jgi:hypothetical protein
VSAAAALAERVRGALRGAATLLPLRLLLLLALAAVVLHLFGLLRLPFPPFTTLGQIYVDSPEVYTRERLVNDRYDQDFWLREQLRLLDAAEARDLLTTRAERDVQVRIADDGSDAAAAAVPVAPPGLTFEQRFELVSGIRDRIRQQMLENMLDDRHDLTGNSVFGLKFDTTVIPGWNTRHRAFVNVVLRPDALFVPADAPADADTGAAALPRHLRSYAERACLANQAAAACGERISAAEQRRHEKQLAHYDAWLTDIAKRLNLTEDSLFESLYTRGDIGCPSPAEEGAATAADAADAAQLRAAGFAFYDELTRRTLRAVLGLPEERFLIHNKPQATLDAYKAAADRADPLFDDTLPVRLPQPWARYLQIRRRPVALPGERPCAYRVWFEVHPVYESFVARPIDPAAPPPQGAAGQPVPIGETKHGTWQLLVQPWSMSDRASFLTSPRPLYTPPADLIELIRDQGGATAVAGEVGLSMLPSGFFNFVESMAGLDAYAYAVFPKNDVQGQQFDSSLRGGAGARGGMLAVADRLVGTRTVPVLVGFGDGQPAEGDPAGHAAVRFGWVVSAEGNMQPSLKTQLALVSVPAWADALHLEITTGWLDGAGRARAASDPFEMDVTVPPDFSAFDSIFRDDAWVTRGPRVQDDSMDPRLYVIAGQPTRILIPGSRLWRSATVTLGAQRADRIRVLPNMEGIIAEFLSVDLPYAQPAADAAAEAHCTLESPKLKDMRTRPVRVRVWTSEGMDDAARPVCVIYDPEAQIRVPVTAAAETPAPAPTPPTAPEADAATRAQSPATDADAEVTAPD